MAETSGKRHAETRLWEQHRLFLEFLFIYQNKTLKEIRNVMTEHCGFDRKEHQYEFRFKNWGLHKNFSKAEWRDMKSLLDQRKLNGKLSTVMSSGRIIKRAQKRIDRHAYRTAYETAYDSLRRQNYSVNLPSHEPTTLMLRTPSPEPCVSNGHEQLSKTFWYSSLSLLDNISNKTSQNQVGIVQQDPTLVLCHAISRMSLQPQYRETSGVVPFLQQRHILRHRLSGSPCGSAINIEETIALRTGEALMDLIKLAIYLISNNIANRTGIGSLLISICQLPTNRNMLEHLLKQEHPTIQAFAEGLLHYASEANDADLVRVLIRRGVDPNSNCGICFGSRTRLICAIRSGSSDAVDALLESGADSERLESEGLSYLKLCYEHNLLPLASKLLQRGIDIPVSDSARPSNKPTMNFVSTAALYGGLPAVKILVEHDPSGFRNMIRADSSQAITMAASVGNETVVQFFLSYDISLSDCGTGLCGAAANGKIQMVRLLLSHGVNVDGSHGWIWYEIERERWEWRYCDISALEAAVACGQLAVARFLLEHRANIEIRPSVLNKLCWTVMCRSSFRYHPDKLDDPVKPENFRVVEPSELSSLTESGKLAERVELVEQLLHVGAKPDEATLVWLTLAGAVGPVRRLVERGAHPNSSVAAWGLGNFSTSRLFSALAAALYAGNDDLASFLLKRGADVNIPAGIEGHMSPLAASISRGRLDWAKELIRRGADLADPIALWSAAHTNSFDAYILICSVFTETHGRSVGEFARFAASEAIIRGNLAFLQTIIANGIHLNAPALPWKHVEDRYWIWFTTWDIPSPNDPLICAVRTGNIDAIQLLLDNGADPNRAHLDDHFKDGLRPILSALSDGCSSLVLCSIASTLINAGAKINYFEPTALNSPLGAAAQLGSVTLLDLLIQNGGLVNAVSSSQYRITTPLCEAVAGGNYKCTRKLLAESARVFGSSQLFYDVTPVTAIQIAARNGHLDMLKLLLDAEEDGAQFISEYPLALRLAYGRGHRTIAKYLQSYRIRSFGHLSCDTDEEILTGVEDERRDVKYWFKFWEDERYSGWQSVVSSETVVKVHAFISGDDISAASDSSSLNRYNNSPDADDNADIDTSSIRASNEENTIVCAETVDGNTKSRNDLTDFDWQEFVNFEPDQSYLMSGGCSYGTDDSTAILAEQTPNEPDCQLVGSTIGSNTLPQFINSDGFDPSQNVAESSDWMNALGADNLFLPWEQSGDGNALTDQDLDLNLGHWPY